MYAPYKCWINPEKRSEQQRIGKFIRTQESISKQTIAHETTQHFKLIQHLCGTVDLLRYWLMPIYQTTQKNNTIQQSTAYYKAEQYKPILQQVIKIQDSTLKNYTGHLTAVKIRILKKGKYEEIWEVKQK